MKSEYEHAVAKLDNSEASKKLLENENRTLAKKFQEKDSELVSIAMCSLFVAIATWLIMYLLQERYNMLLQKEKEELLIKQRSLQVAN